MVLVTKYQYYMNDELVKKLDLICNLLTNKVKKKDAVLINEGGEGEGKTTMSIAQAFYVADQTGRKFNESNVFFKIDNLIEFAQKTKDQIIIWDEPALESLGDDSRGKVVRDLFRLFMMARKKRHFFIINITHFDKFNHYVIVDRPVGMLKIYSRQGENQGRFAYIYKKNLTHLWNDWKVRKKKSYAKYGSKKCRGTFPDILNPKYRGNVLEGFNVDKYEDNKDEAIMSIGNKAKEGATKKLNRLQTLIYTLKGMTQKEKGDHFGVRPATISEWGRFEHNKDVSSRKYSEIR